MDVMRSMLLALLVLQDLWPDVAATTRTLVNALMNGRTAPLVERFDEKMRAALPESQLGVAVKAVQSQAGAFRGVTATRTMARDGVRMVVATCDFENGQVDVSLAYDATGRIVGLNMRPASVTSEYRPPTYVSPDRYTETCVTVDAGTGWPLPGTLTVPRGDGPFAAVVLVHGSGPNDRDETVGPNRPFRDLGRQHTFIRDFPLGLLISATATGLKASPLRFDLETADAPFGVLRGHLARANAHWHSLEGADVLVVFQGPNAYVSPAWYASKAEHGKVVPTWNYVMVQARGVARVRDDERWLRQQVTKLTETHESSRETPWHVADAPPAFVEAQLRGIVGVEIEIRAIDGKWKVSQNRTVADRHGVADGLAQSGHAAMAALVHERTAD